MDIFSFVRNINGIVKFCYGLCDREMPRRYVLSSDLVYDDLCRIAGSLGSSLIIFSSFLFFCSLVIFSSFLFFRSLVKNDSLGNFDFNRQRHLDFS